MSELVVFIAWAGPRGRRIAAALREFLPSVNPHFAAWYDHGDVEPGEDWRRAVLERVAQAHCMVLCITEDALSSPWMAYEAGYFAGREEGGGERALITMMCGPGRAEMSGTHPLYPVLKSVGADQAGWWELCLTLHRLAKRRGIGGRAMTEELTKKNFRAHWPATELELSARMDEVTAPPSDRAMLQQVLQVVQALQVEVAELRGQPRTLAWIEPEPAFEGVEQADSTSEARPGVRISPEPAPPPPCAARGHETRA